MNRSFFKILLSGSAAVWIALTCHPVVAQTDRVVITPPIPVLKSPMESFRKLLAMPVAERRQFLSTRSTNVQERLVQKLREYQSLTPEERELRLKATELRWYLQPLMRTPATNRPAYSLDTGGAWRHRRPRRSRRNARAASRGVACGPL